jgi:hypothetical protein
MSQVNANGNGAGYQAASDLEQPHSPSNSMGKEGNGNGATVYRSKCQIFSLPYDFFADAPPLSLLQQPPLAGILPMTTSWPLETATERLPTHFPWVPCPSPRLR